MFVTNIYIDIFFKSFENAAPRQIISDRRRVGGGGPAVINKIGKHIYITI